MWETRRLHSHVLTRVASPDIETIKHTHCIRIAHTSVVCRACGQVCSRICLPKDTCAPTFRYPHPQCAAPRGQAKAGQRRRDEICYRSSSHKLQEVRLKLVNGAESNLLQIFLAQASGSWTRYTTCSACVSNPRKESWPAAKTSTWALTSTSLKQPQVAECLSSPPLSVQEPSFTPWSKPKRQTTCPLARLLKSLGDSISCCALAPTTHVAEPRHNHSFLAAAASDAAR